MLALGTPIHVVAYYSAMHCVFVLDTPCMNTRIYVMNYECIHEFICVQPHPRVSRLQRLLDSDHIQSCPYRVGEDIVCGPKP